MAEWGIPEDDVLDFDFDNGKGGVPEELDALFASFCKVMTDTMESIKKVLGQSDKSPEEIEVLLSQATRHMLGRTLACAQIVSIEMATASKLAMISVILSTLPPDEMANRWVDETAQEVLAETGEIRPEKQQFGKFDPNSREALLRALRMAASIEPGQEQEALDAAGSLMGLIAAADAIITERWNKEGGDGQFDS